MTATDLRREFKNAAINAGYNFYYDTHLKLWVLYKQNFNQNAEYFTLTIMKYLGVEQFKEIYLL